MLGISRAVRSSAVGHEVVGVGVAERMENLLLYRLDHLHLYLLGHHPQLPQVHPQLPQRPLVRQEHQLDRLLDLRVDPGMRRLTVVSLYKTHRRTSHLSLNLSGAQGLETGCNGVQNLGELHRIPQT